MGVFRRVRQGAADGKGRQILRELRWMWRYVVRWRGSVACYLLMGLLGVVAGLGSSVASKYLIDAVTGFKTTSIGGAAGLMAGMLLLSVGIRALSSRLSARIDARVRNELRAELFATVLHADWESLQPFHSGDLLNRLNTDTAAVASAAVTLLPKFLMALTQFVGALVVILIYDPVMALIVLLSAPASAVASRFLMRRMRQYSQKIRRLDSDIMAYNEDTFQNLQTVKAFDVGDHFEGRLDVLQDKAYTLSLDYNRFSIFTSTVMSLVGMLVYAGCFGWGVFRLWSGAITYGTMTLFLQMSSTVSGAFSSVIGTVPTAINAATSAGRLMELDDLPREASVSGLFEGCRPELHLENVHFAYRGGKPVLRDVSLTVRPGEMIGIVGPSGEGKTTLVRLLLGLVTPSAGRIFLADADSGDEVDVSIRRSCAYVPQGNTLFAGTVAENLRLTREGATDEELERALRAADAWDFVQELPDGLNSPVGEHGGGFSEGQAQRLAIARALLKDAPILILDEATSALDAQREQQVLKALAAGDPQRITLVITHRPGVLPLCDRVYRVDDTRLTEVRCPTPPDGHMEEVGHGEP